MATISITIPDGKLVEVRDAICETYHYSAVIVDDAGLTIPNPETKTQFAKRMVARFVHEIYQAWKVKQAVAVAQAASIAESDTVIIE